MWIGLGFELPKLAAVPHLPSIRYTQATVSILKIGERVDSLIRRGTKTRAGQHNEQGAVPCNHIVKRQSVEDDIMCASQKSCVFRIS